MLASRAAGGTSGGSWGSTVQVRVSQGDEEQVLVDPVHGPLVTHADGVQRPIASIENCYAFNRVGCADVRQYSKPWTAKSSTERNILLDIAARKNRSLREWQSAAAEDVRRQSELPDFLQGFEAVRWSDEQVQGSFAEVSEPPPAELQFAGAAPVLVVFYSGGTSQQQGQELVRDFLEAARKQGLTNQVVLHHPEAYDVEGEGTEPWPAYIDRLVEEIDREPDRRGRPLLVWGHSKGATSAVSLASRLGDRVLKVYCVASSAPSPGEISPFQRMAEDFKRGTDLDLLLWFCSLNADPALHRMVEACSTGEMAIESSPYLRGKLALMKRQYVNAIYPDMGRDFQVIPAPILAVWPKQDASSPQHEVQAWSAWTAGGFELRPVAAGHMDCLRTSEHHEHIALDMVRVARERARAR